MRLSSILFCGLASLTSSCAIFPDAFTTTPGEGDSNLSSNGESQSSTGDSAREASSEPGDASFAAPAGFKPAAPLNYRLEEGPGSYWRSPEFTRRYMESFLAETDLEPFVTIEEQKVLQNVGKAMSSDQEDKAIRLLASEVGPQASAVLDFNLGNLYLGREDLESAVEAYTNGVEKFPKFLRAWKKLGISLYRLEEYGPSAKALTRVVELGGGDGLNFGLLGTCYENLSKHISAESAYRMATMLDPDTLNWKVGLARTFFAQSRYGDAQTLCAELIAEQPESTGLWLLQARAFHGLGETMRAAENLELVDRMGGSTAASLNNLGDIYINEKLFDLAVSSYIRSLELEKPADFGRVTRAAKALSANEDFDGVLHLVAETRRLHGESLSAETQQDLYRLEAGVALARGQGDEEAKLLKEIIQLNPLDGEALVFLGQHAESLGRSRAGDFLLRTRRRTSTGMKARAKRRHGQLLVREERFQDALVLLKRAMALKPSGALQDYIDQVEKIAKSSS